jgi:lysophospholipase L1-like esterase
MNILVGGDSFTTRWGVDKCWADYISGDLINTSVPGISNKDIAKRIKLEINDLTDMVLVLWTVQARDYTNMITFHAHTIPTVQQYIEDYYNNVNEIIDICKTHDTKLIMAQGLPVSIEPNSESKVSFTYEDLLLEQSMQKSKCKATLNNFIDWDKVESSLWLTMVDSDMIIGNNDHHPNEKGHQYIAERFYEVIN